MPAAKDKQRLSLYLSPDVVRALAIERGTAHANRALEAAAEIVADATNSLAEKLRADEWKKIAAVMAAELDHKANLDPRRLLAIQLEARATEVLCQRIRELSLAEGWAIMFALQHRQNILNEGKPLPENWWTMAARLGGE